MITAASLAAAHAALRERQPLVHNIISAVSANFAANVLLALGAAPAMAESPDEVESFAAAADALAVNLGMITPPRATAMRLAAASAAAVGTPWALDPVGAGAIADRTSFAHELCRLRPTAIRGNASEILGLSGEAGRGRGVDAGTGSGEALMAARRLAAETGAVVAVTGAVDYVTDGARAIALRNGHPMMTRITAMGCAATAVAAACVAVGDDPLLAVSHGLSMVGIAGEMAAQTARGPGSMQVAFLDALSALDYARLRIGVGDGASDAPAIS
jgi:hydroxyethylthiazole kinase